MTPDHVQHDPAVAASLDRVRRQWGSAVEEGAPESASIKSSAFAPAETTNAGAPPAPVSAPRRSVATGDGDAGPEDFVLGELLGKGGMGLVFRAEQAGLDRDVALKTILPGHAADGTARRKFFAEAQVTGQLDHPNIVPIYELAAAPDGALFYTMKEVRGRPWSKAMPTLSEAENVDILLKVADAVAFAHGKGVIHRDLKPENVMLGDYGEVLLMDWGLAVGVADGAKAERLSPANARGGTPAYMAPEMAAADAEKIGPASDVYLLGAILYEILTGLRPHHAENVFACIAAALQNTVQPSERRDEMSAVARRALATAPAERFRDVRAFQRAVRDCREHAASLALSNEARATLKRARDSGDYTDFARSVFGFGEALRLWPDNGTADLGLTMARKHYAEAALERGDYDLALSQTKMMSADGMGDLSKRAEEGKAERERRRVRVKRLTRLSTGLVGLVLVVGGIAYWRVSKAEAAASDDARMAREAERRADEALANANKALSDRSVALEASREAERKSREAQERAEVALLAKEKAEAQERTAREEQAKLSGDLAKAMKELDVWQDTEATRASLLSSTSNQATPLTMAVQEIGGVRPRTEDVSGLVRALAALSMATRQTEEIASLVTGFEGLEVEAARGGDKTLRDQIHRMTNLLRRRLPDDHPQRPEKMSVVNPHTIPDEKSKEGDGEGDVEAEDAENKESAEEEEGAMKDRRDYGSMEFQGKVHLTNINIGGSQYFKFHDIKMGPDGLIYYNDYSSIQGIDPVSGKILRVIYGPANKIVRLSDANGPLMSVHTAPRDNNGKSANPLRRPKNIPNVEILHFAPDARGYIYYFVTWIKKEDKPPFRIELRRVDLMGAAGKIETLARADIKKGDKGWVGIQDEDRSAEGVYPFDKLGLGVVFKRVRFDHYLNLLPTVDGRLYFESHNRLYRFTDDWAGVTQEAFISDSWLNESTSSHFGTRVPLSHSPNGSLLCLLSGRIHEIHPDGQRTDYKLVAHHGGSLTGGWCTISSAGDIIIAGDRSPIKVAEWAHRNLGPERPPPASYAQAHPWREWLGYYIPIDFDALGEDVRILSVALSPNNETLYLCYYHAPILKYSDSMGEMSLSVARYKIPPFSAEADSIRRREIIKNAAMNESFHASMRAANPDYDPAFVTASRSEKGGLNYVWVKGRANVKDITPLARLGPVGTLSLAVPRGFDLSQIVKMDIDFVELTNCISVNGLAGLKCKELDVSHNSIADISPLADIECETLDVSWNRIEDVTPLLTAKIENLLIKQNKIKDLRILAENPFLKKIEDWTLSDAAWENAQKSQFPK